MREKKQGPSFALSGYRKQTALLMLCEHYGRNPEFMAEFSAFVNKHQEKFELVSSYHGLGGYTDLDRLSSWWSSKAPLIKLIYQQHGLSSTLGDAEAIAVKWGLNAAWGPPLLLQQASGLVFCGEVQEAGIEFPTAFIRDAARDFPPMQEMDLSPLWSFLFPPKLIYEDSEDHDVPVIVDRRCDIDTDSLPQAVNLPASAVVLADRYDPTCESREAFLKRALDTLTKEADRIEASYREHSMEKQGGKSELETHVEWLYERIALKSTPREIVEKHSGDSKPPGQHAVEDGVRKVAQLLGITLPRNRIPYIR